MIKQKPFVFSKYMLDFYTYFMYNEMAMEVGFLIFDLTRLKNKVENQIVIEMDYQIDDDLLSTTDIISPFSIHMNGVITRDPIDGFWLDVRVSGEMILPCSVTLEPVVVPIQIQIVGNLDELSEEALENHKKIENSIDILPIIWENIVIEIPMKVTSPNAYSKKVKGEGWEFVTEKREQANPALAKLKDLL